MYRHARAKCDGPLFRGSWNCDITQLRLNPYHKVVKCASMMS